MPPYIEVRAYIRVRALVRGELYDGHVLGWRGKPVYMQWRTDLGDHLGRVQRRTCSG
jgi:hypothetical protein